MTARKAKDDIFHQLSLTDVKAIFDFADLRLRKIKAEMNDYKKTMNPSFDQKLELEKSIEYWSGIKYMALCRIDEMIREVFTTKI